MRQFTKAQEAARADVVRRLRRAADEVEAEVIACNEAIADAYQRVADKVDLYNSIITDANELLTTLKDDAQSYFDDRSEAWQEGEAGEAYAEWINELEHEFEEIDVENQPEIDTPDLSAADDLEAVPSEVGGG